jgi:hypothetical protein
MRLVPEHPTDDMLIAGQEAWAKARHKIPKSAIADCDEAQAVYLAMLSASPTPASPAALSQDELRNALFEEFGSVATQKVMTIVERLRICAGIAHGAYPHQSLFNGAADELERLSAAWPVEEQPAVNADGLFGDRNSANALLDQALAKKGLPGLLRPNH